MSTFLRSKLKRWAYEERSEPGGGGMGARLRQLTTTLLTIGLLSSACALQRVPELPNEPPEAVLEPHVIVGNIRIRKTGNISRGSHGAGTVIGHKAGRTYILTARHTTEENEATADYSYKLGVWTHETAYPIEAQIERISRHGLDAAIISTKAIDHRVAKTSRRDPATGEQVFVLGSPSGSFRTIYRRRVLRYESGRFYRGLHYQLTTFLLDGPILPGFSGGGVFNSYEELVGICYARRTERQGQGVCIPIRALDELLEPYL